MNPTKLPLPEFLADLSANEHADTHNRRASDRRRLFADPDRIVFWVIVTMVCVAAAHDWLP